VSETAEIIKAVAELLKPFWGPCAIVVSVWIMREPLRALIAKIKKITIGHGEILMEPLLDFLSTFEFRPRLLNVRIALESF